MTILGVNHVQIGALVPLSRPGWVEAGRHLLAGLELAVREVNDAGGIAGATRAGGPGHRGRSAAGGGGRRRTGAPGRGRRGGRVSQRRRSRRRRPGRRARPAVPLLVSGARRAHRPADGLGRAPRPGAVPRLADLRRLPARRGPPADRRRGAAERLLGRRDPHPARPPRSGHRRRARPATAVCDELVDDRATALLLLVGHPEPAVSIVKAVRRDPRLAERHDRRSGRAAGVRRMGGAAGRRRRRDPVPALPARAPQPARHTRRDGPPRAAGRGALLRRLRGLRHDRRPRRCAARSRARGRAWPRVAVEGTRGPIRFSRMPGISVWQWAWPPIQVVDRDPAHPDRFTTSRSPTARQGSRRTSPGRARRAA